MGSVGVSIFNIVSIFMYFDDLYNYYLSFVLFFVFFCLIKEEISF